MWLLCLPESVHLLRLGHLLLWLKTISKLRLTKLLIGAAYHHLLPAAAILLPHLTILLMLLLLGHHVLQLLLLRLAE